MGRVLESPWEIRLIVFGFWSEALMQGHPLFARMLAAQPALRYRLVDPGMRRAIMHEPDLDGLPQGWNWDGPG